MLLPGNHLRRSSYRSREFEPVQERRVCTELAVCSKWSVTRWYCEEYRSVLTTAIARSSVSCAAPVCIKLNPAPGGDNNLNVILSTYEPHHNIRCGRSENFGNAPSCENVLADMPATEEMTLFGPGTAPGIEEPLPQLIASADEKCFLRLFSTGRADWASWYSIWQATEATFARCGRKRRFGNFRGLGGHGDIFFTLAGVSSVGSLDNISSQAATA